jgi:hypothetical protein
MRSFRPPLARLIAPVALLAVAALGACTAARPRTDIAPLPAGVDDFAARYTAAWCSHEPARVASFYAADGSLQINDGQPAVGRAQIAASAQAFMTAFPDIVVQLDRLTPAKGGRVEYHWTLMGRNTGPGGTGHRVRINGFEDWRLGADGLIAESKGHYDAPEYARQVRFGYDGPR